MGDTYKIAFIAYTIMSVLNLAVVLYEIKKSHSLITIVRMLSDVGLHLVVAYAYYSEWTSKDEFKSLKKRKN